VGSSPISNLVPMASTVGTSLEGEGHPGRAGHRGLPKLLGLVIFETITTSNGLPAAFNCLLTSSSRRLKDLPCGIVCV